MKNPLHTFNKIIIPLLLMVIMGWLFYGAATVPVVLQSNGIVCGCIAETMAGLPSMDQCDQVGEKYEILEVANCNQIGY